MILLCTAMSVFYPDLGWAVFSRFRTVRLVSTSPAIDMPSSGMLSPFRAAAFQPRNKALILSGEFASVVFAHDAKEAKLISRPGRTALLGQYVCDHRDHS